MKLSALLAVSAFLAEGTLALNCKDGLNYCGRSIMLKNPDSKEAHQLLKTCPLRTIGCANFESQTTKNILTRILFIV